MPGEYQRWIANHMPVDPRGQCADVTKAMTEAFPELRRVRGHYLCPLENRRIPHWWLVTREGRIVDPTVEQFASLGAGDYEEYTGPEPRGQCLNCGELVFDDTFLCSEQCFQETKEFFARGGTLVINGKEIANGSR